MDWTGLARIGTGRLLSEPESVKTYVASPFPQ